MPSHSSSGIAQSELLFHTERNKADLPPVQESTNLKPSNLTDIAPYQRWVETPLPRPEKTSQQEIAETFVEIVNAEGPMLCHLVYRRYAKAVGVQRIRKQLRSILNRAMAYALRKGLLVQREDHGARNQMHRIVRHPQTPSIVVREKGDRTIEEVPPDEITSFMNLYRRNHNITDKESLIRETASHYGVLRISEQARQIFDDAFNRLLASNLYP